MNNKLWSFFAWILLFGCTENSKSAPENESPEKTVSVEEPSSYDIEIQSTSEFEVVPSGILKESFFPLSPRFREVFRKIDKSILVADLKPLGKIKIIGEPSKQVILQKIGRQIGQSTGIQFRTIMNSTTNQIAPNEMLLFFAENATMTLVMTDTAEENVYDISASLIVRESNLPKQ